MAAQQQPLACHGHSRSLVLANDDNDDDIVTAFKHGERDMAEQLLPITSKPATITTRFQFPYSAFVGMVTLLHLAAYHGWKDIVTALVEVHNCCVFARDEQNHNPLHYAAYQGQLEVVKYLQSLNPLQGDSYRMTPLYYACQMGHLDVVKYFIDKLRHNPSHFYKCFANTTPRTIIDEIFHLQTLTVTKRSKRTLTPVYKPSIKMDEDNTLLHVACQNGHFHIVQYLIGELHCHLAWYIDTTRKTLLHYACQYGHLNIAQYLINEAQCDPACHDAFRFMPLHLACSEGHIKIAKYLINDCHCNPASAITNGITPLHMACSNGHIEIAKYLINDLNCDPLCIDTIGFTPLHVACINSHAIIVKFLLSIGQVNPLVEDKQGHTPLYYASGKYDIIKLFESFKNCRVAFPVHTFTKLILTGDSGAGKTTTANFLVHLASNTTDIPVECTSNTEPELTAGIVQHRIQSEKIGNFIIYDFAGQQEYYSSHAAILEQVMRKSPAVFLCLIDLSKSNESICQSLNYWISFIDNACSSVEEKSHILIIGSHADQASSLIEEKNSLIQTIAVRRIKHQEFMGFVAMDCRRLDTDYLISKLTDCQSSIAESQPIISFYNHVVYAFLQTKLDVVGCTLDHLITKITAEDDSALPTDVSVLTETLTTLSDKGLILFIHDPRSESESWVIVKTEALLTEVNGTLFAPNYFEEHRPDLASNTGIVSISSLSRVFPDYDAKMLVSFLESLHFCRSIDTSELKNTNLASSSSHLITDLLFFPGLIQLERPKGLIPQGAFQFGWCLKCVSPNEFFSTRFLHVLLLSVAYKFPLFCQHLHRMCNLWRNGIFWRNYDNITTVIEVLDNNRRVIVAMSCDESDHNSQIEHAKLRSSLISLVRSLQHEYCKSLSVREFLISPDLVSQYPMDSNLPDSDLFDICHVARAMLLHKKVVPSYMDSTGYLSLQSLPFEPYHHLESSFICQLLNPDIADEEVPTSLLHKIRTLCHQPKMEPQVYKNLREFIDGLSLFAGRDPLEVAGLNKDDLPNDDAITGSTSTLNINDLAEVRRLLKNIVDWKSLGLELGLLYPSLKKIEVDQRGLVEQCKTEMLAAWLQEQDNPSWSVLRVALKSIGENELADKISNR